MASSTIPVDLFNPGQVLACIGIAEVAEVLLGGVRCGWDWDHASAWFSLSAGGEEAPLDEVMTFLDTAKSVVVIPRGSSVRAETSLQHRISDYAATPYPAPEKRAKLTMELETTRASIALTHWADGPARTGRDGFKLWAGSGGKSGACFVAEALDAARRHRTGQSAPFSLAAPQGGSLRFDWRRDYVPIELGFSLNRHTAMESVGYPLVEVLAAIGASYARPSRVRPRDKLDYRYRVVRADHLPLSLIRAAFGGGSLPHTTRTFRIQLDWPGQENQARCITQVTEETNHDTDR